MKHNSIADIVDEGIDLSRHWRNSYGILVAVLCRLNRSRICVLRYGLKAWFRSAVVSLSKTIAQNNLYCISRSNLERWLVGSVNLIIFLILSCPGCELVLLSPLSSLKGQHMLYVSPDLKVNQNGLLGWNWLVVIYISNHKPLSSVCIYILEVYTKSYISGDMHMTLSCLTLFAPPTISNVLLWGING